MARRLTQAACLAVGSLAAHFAQGDAKTIDSEPKISQASEIMLTIKSVPRAKPTDQPTVQVGDEIYPFQPLQMALQQVSGAATGTDYTVTVQPVTPTATAPAK
jgi:hypothetical protein